MAEYPVLCGDERVGRLRVTQEGGFLRVETMCRRDETGLFRAFLICRRGERPMGVLEPEGEQLYLCRRFPVRDIDSCGGIERGEVRLSYAFHQKSIWQNVENGAAFFAGDEFRVGSWEGALWRGKGTCRELALRWQEGKEFPLCPLFCFARITVIEGKRYVVYTFDREERPVMVK